MAARAGRPGNSVLASLPPQAQVSAHVPASFVSNSQPVNFTFDSQHIGILRANQKALGILGPSDPTYNSPDGKIEFNTLFNFDYRGNVVDPSKMDFQTVAAHEIGHLLGFISSVDEIDATTAATDPSIAPTTLDLFRFARLSGNPSTVADFTAFARNLVPGTDTVLDDLSNEYRLSDGLNSDGRQASHWKDNLGIGIMDPTTDTGEQLNISNTDLRAMDVMGYTLAPEPSVGLLLGLIALGAGLGARFRARQVGSLRALGA